MFKKTITSILFFIALINYNYCYGKPPIFVTSPEDAFALSEDMGMDLLLVFTATWCSACMVMKNDLHNNLSVIDDTIICYVDHDQRKDMVKEYNVKSLPSYFLYRNKAEKRMGIGYKTLSKFKQWLDNE